MTDSIDQQHQSQTYSRDLFREQFRILDADAPDDAIAEIEVFAKASVRYLNPKDEESRTHDANAWQREFAKKARVREGIEKLKESLANMAVPDMPSPQLPAPTLSDRLAELRYFFETDPAAAASTVFDGITDPTTDHPWRRLLVIAAEGIHFTDDQDRQLIPALMEFIENFRDSNGREDQVAVCSAIRSYVGLAGTAQVESVAELLEPGYRASPTLDTLLETLKMVARKFAANPPGSPNQYPALTGQIERVARAYLNPYVLPQDKHAAVAMNAMQALAALASPELGTVIAEVNTCCPAWFRQQLQRRLTKLSEEWETKLGDGVVVHQPTKIVREASERLQTD